MQTNELFGSIRQFSIVVKDVQETVRLLADSFGIGPWDGYHVDKDMVRNMTYRHKRMDYAADVCVSYIGKIEIELVQPLDEHNIYMEFLKEHGQGLHHVCYDVEDFDKTDEVLMKLGCERVLEGTMAGGTFFAYYDCRRTMGCYLELRKEVEENNDLPKMFPCPQPSETAPVFSNTLQISLTVRDVKETARKYEKLLGIMPWQMIHYDSSNVSLMKYCGRRLDYAMDIGVCVYGDAEIELVESAGGENIYADFLKEHGEGLHHICFDTEDFDRADRAMAACGFPKVQEGIIENETYYAYYDCRKKLGFYIELYTSAQ